MASPAVVQAYRDLGLEVGASLEIVKATYKQAARRTHPDKNLGNESATEEFQRIGAAYNVLVKHFAPRPTGPSVTVNVNPFPGGYPFSGFGYGSPFSDDDFSDGYEYGFDESDDDYDADLAFYMWMFENMMNDRMGSRKTYKNAHRNPIHQTPRETNAQYQERLRRSREEQQAAQERRKRESIARKERAAREREQERLDAESRQKEKIQAKKAQAETIRKSSEARAKELQKNAQKARSAVFLAARKGESDKVKKGIWDNEVNPAGGEINIASSDIEVAPQDPQQTLLHIASQNGDLDLVEWLDSHSAEPEERDSQNLTAFHIALSAGHLPIVRYFLKAYPPELPDSKDVYECRGSTDLITLALQSRDPEHVWLILDHKLASPQEIRQALAWASSEEGLRTLRGERPNPADIEKAEDIVKLLKQFDKSANSSSTSSGPSVYRNQEPVSNHTQASKSGSTPQIPRNNQASNRGRGNNGQSRGRGRGRGRNPRSAPSL